MNEYSKLLQHRMPTPIEKKNYFAGFTSDVRVFEMVYDKTDNFQALKKVFDLVGHNSRIFSSDFSTDCSKMVTVSKDGTWKLYDTSGKLKLEPTNSLFWNWCMKNLMIFKNYFLFIIEVTFYIIFQVTILPWLL